MQFHEIKKTHKNKKRKLVGRGGKRGTTSGRGTKGQKARSGHRIRPQLRDEIKKLHKKRGFGIHRADSVNAERAKAKALSLSALGRVTADGDIVTPAFLFERGLLKRKDRAKVKILGGGGFLKKITLSGCEVSASARSAIEKAGGTIQNLENSK